MALPTLFYLDAHWNDHLPLREEVELALKHFAKAVLIIDDFAVPDDPGYAFDDYGPGKALTLDYLARAERAAANDLFSGVGIGSRDRRETRLGRSDARTLKWQLSSTSYR